MANYTADDLASIKAMIAGGLTQAMIAGEMVQYRSLAELQKIQRLIEADIGGAVKVAFPVRQVSTDRGL